MCEEGSSSFPSSRRDFEEKYEDLSIASRVCRGLAAANAIKSQEVIEEREQAASRLFDEVRVFVFL